MAVASAASSSGNGLAAADGVQKQPWLLPSNRRLRNLISISLRQLSLARLSSSHQRGQAIDDDALPNTHTSPAKIVALRDHKIVEHSRSSSDLRSVAEHSKSDPFIERPSKSAQNGQTTASRPPLPRLRRRSTLEWANASPQKRQEKLEHAAAQTMADVFFTCHIYGIKDPIYISEIAAHTMNATFRHIDLSLCGFQVARCSEFTVKFWVRGASMSSWRPFLQFPVDLRSLQYLGSSLELLDHVLPRNTVVFHMIDGVYTTPEVSSRTSQPLPPTTSSSRRENADRSLPTASFDALLRLTKLDDSIQDALGTRDRIAANLETLIRNNNASLITRDGVVEADDRLKTIEYARATVEKQLQKAIRQHEEKKISLEARRTLMSNDRVMRELAEETMNAERPDIPSSREEHEVKQKAIQNQRRRICEDLQRCYPIQPVPSESLAFTIHGLYLPNSDNLDRGQPEQVAAALGQVAHIILLLSSYFRRPLPYPVNPRGSTSTIDDRLSLLKTNTSKGSANTETAASRIYPLFTKGVPRFRFDYAVFLLNKDIQILLETAFNVRVLDLRHTLPNLKYLLYVATAGAGELPARKAGGVRGLMPSRSTDSGSDGDLRPAAKREPIERAGGAVESLKRTFVGVAKAGS